MNTCTVLLILFAPLAFGNYISPTPCNTYYDGEIQSNLNFVASVGDIALLYCAKSNLNVIYKYNVSSNTWNHDTVDWPLPNAVAVTLGDSVFFSTVDNLPFYNSTNDSISELNMTGTPVALVQNTLFLLEQSNVTLYNLYTGVTTNTTISTSYKQQVTIVNQDAIVIIGQNTNQTWLIDIYNISTNSWNSLKLPSNYSFVNAIQASNKILFFSSVTKKFTIDIYDFENQSFTSSFWNMTLGSNLNQISAGNYALFAAGSSLWLYDTVSFTNTTISPISDEPVIGDRYVFLPTTSYNCSMFDMSSGQFITLDFSIIGAAFQGGNKYIAIEKMNLNYNNNQFTNITLRFFDPELRQLFPNQTLPSLYGYYVPGNVVISLKSGILFISFNTTYGVIKCNSNSTCDDGIFCNGNEYCHSNGYCSIEPRCSSSLICQQCNEDAKTCFSPIGTVCEQKSFCEGLFTCDGFGACVSGGDPCAHYPECNRFCNEVSQNCTVNLYGTQCGDGSCHICNGHGQCKFTCDNKIIISVLCVTSALMVAIIVLLIVKRRRKATYQLVPTEEQTEDTEIPSVYLIEDIVVMHRLAGGEFGDVYQGIMDQSIPVALKSLKASEFTAEFQREAKLLSALNNPNIVRLYGVHLTSNSERYMVFEFMSEGSLNKLLVSEKNIDLNILLSMASQVSSGMKYLEANHVIHRDLALRNVLVSKEGSKYIVKIGDFGLSRASEKGYYKTQDKTIPVRWSAPEFLNFGTSSSKSDVFSFGVCLWELMSYGAVPYAGMNNLTVVEQVTNGYRLPKPANCPGDVYEVMFSCWDADPEKRPTFVQLHNKIVALSKKYQKIVVDEESQYNT